MRAIRSPSAVKDAVRSLYVHAPFCARRCVYCDFAVTVDRRPDSRDWLSTIAREWEGIQAEGRFPVEGPIETLYVGGGTPSLLGPAAMQGLSQILAEVMPPSHPPEEWTAEANPESLTPDLARDWREAGVNRLSLGVQSFDPEVLRWMGRLHGPEGAVAAVDAARRAGFENLSVDLVFGLPEGVERSWEDDVEHALALEVPHLSLYGLTIEAGTRLGERLRTGSLVPAPEDRYRDEYLFAVERLEEAGYRAYELSNFARPGAESRHNQVYWRGDSYLGLGNGAHSYRHPVRRWNERDWPRYRERIRRDGLAPAEAEVVDEEAHRLEGVWLGLRRASGLELPAGTATARRRVASWAEAGWARLDGDRVRLTPEGWLLLDRLAVELDEALAVQGEGGGPGSPASRRDGSPSGVPGS